MQSILYIADHHSAADHVADKDQGNFLKHSQRVIIVSAVKVAPLQSAAELFRNVQNSLTKVIDCHATLRKLVERLLPKEPLKINSVVLEGFL